MTIKTAIDELFALIMPIATATVSSASVYYVWLKIDWPFAQEMAMLIFVLALLKAWGNDSIGEL